MKNKILTVLSLVMCLVMCGALFAGCEKQAQKDGPVDNRTLALDKTELTVVIGENAAKLNAILSSGRGTFVWTCSDEQIATVDQNGKVTGLSVGTATVTVSCASLAPATCQVNVVLPGSVPVFTADPTGEGIHKTVAQGATVQLECGVKFGGEAVEAQLSFRSQDQQIVTVSDTGVITGVKAGTTQVQVVANYLGIEAHMTVEVTVLAE